MWLKEIENFGSEGVARLIVGNKCDLSSKRAIPVHLGKVSLPPPSMCITYLLLLFGFFLS